MANGRWSKIVWLFDWYLRLEWLGKAIAATGFGIGILSSFGAFFAAVVQGITPLIALFLAILALLLVAVLTLVIMEVTGTRIPPKHIHHHSATVTLAPAAGVGVAATFVPLKGSTVPLPVSQLPKIKSAPWLSVNVFTVAQAATLWAGEQPGISFAWDKGKNPAIAAAEQMIVSELRAQLDTTHAALASIGDYSNAEVAAADLIGLAKRKGLAPEFLARRSDW